MTTEHTSVAASHVNALRGFNRFYTRRIGVLNTYMGSELTLAEVRVLYELANRNQPTASELAQDLTLDAGYLSRILSRFEGKQWLVRTPSPADARQNQLVLTPAGNMAFEPLQQRSRDEAAALLAPLSATDRHRLIDAMEQVQRLLEPPTGARKTPLALIREPQAGDMGWVVQQHGEIYAREYGWNADFEALVADIAVQYVRQYKADSERCWMAELNGERVGSVFVVRKSKTVAQLRMLILTPNARGLGLGARLTDECISFARSKGYKKMVLWTNSCLIVARSIYAKRGFKLIKSEAYQGFGQSLVGETWELKL
jgi:DNA-binding MarR family transcriptional regulator/N-acetylglutamate synthase-like GNAT family acetyltransferase